MEFRDIVNRDIVNLENCEDEAIHIPGLIQPHGFLIAVDVNTSIINVCSENISEFLAVDHTAVLGKHINSVFEFSLDTHIKDIQEDTGEQKITFNEVCAGKLLAFTIHKSDNTIIVEGETTENHPNEEAKLYNASKKLLSYIEDTNSLKDLCNSVAQAIKEITGYDRVMIYKFDQEYNGEVYAEVKEEHLESFLGLHYPHTDIPPQARALYIKNLLRIIGDVNYQPVKLFTYDKSNLETLDLGLSVLRSVSPIHVQYLNNMGVGATLTVSLLHKGKLWGLIACHHYGTKFLSQEVRNTVKLHGHFITSQIDVRILNEQYEISNQANQCVDKLTAKELPFVRASVQELFNDDAIYNLCNSNGVVAFIGGEYYTRGNVPEENKLATYIDLLVQEKNQNTFISSNMPQLHQLENGVLQEFPGVLFYRLDNVNYIAWFRVPTIKTITWAGDPSKAIEKDKNGLSPRKSFQSFEERVKDTSKPWLTPEIEAAQKFRLFLQSLVRSILTNEDKERQRILSENLKAVNTELENISWISTHDLQEPLRKIRMMASTLLENPEQYQVTDIVVKRITRMAKSAERMQNLVRNILDYNKTSAELQELEEIDFYALMVKIEEDIKESLKEEGATMQVSKDLPTISGIPFLIKQCVLNIISNALKFKFPERDVVIQVYTDVADEKSDLYHVVAIKDNGIGFDQEHKDKIFKIFSRLHSKSEFEGTGIGLAFCKKIMLKHNGFIRADGVKDIGAIIRLYFPK